VYVTVFEVSKPADQRSVYVGDDCLQAVSVAAPCLAPYGVFEFPEALPARSMSALLEVVSQKIESTTVGDVYNAGFVLMEFQSG